MKKRRGPAGGRTRPPSRSDSGAGRDDRGAATARRGDDSSTSRLAALLALPALWLITALVHAPALLLGASTIAFTPLHWATGMGEILVATFSLAALHVHLLARERDSRLLPWVTAALVLGAALSKESAVLLPVVLLVAERRMGH